MSSDGYRSPLSKMTSISDTDLWNDSCSIKELEYAIGHGAVGATANPVIVGEVLKKEMLLWKTMNRKKIDDQQLLTRWEVIKPPADVSVIEN